MVVHSESEAREFRVEALDVLAAVEERLIFVEKGGCFPTAYPEIFRAFHNLKGSCAMFGFDELRTLFHCLETQFQECASLRQPTMHVTGYFLSGIDAARALLDGKKMEMNGSLAFSPANTPEGKREQRDAEPERENAPRPAPCFSGEAENTSRPIMDPDEGRSMPRGLLQKLHWRETYATGAPELDFPHQFLLAQFSLAAAFFTEGPPDRCRLVLILAELTGILRLHFAIEDHEMAVAGTPETAVARHREAHARAAERLRAYEEDLAKGKVMPSRVILSVLAKDFLLHLGEEVQIFRRRSCA